MKTRLLVGIVAVAGWAAANASAATVTTVTTNNLNEPHSIAVDSSGSVYYVTDAANNRVVKYDASTATLSLVAGSVSGGSLGQGTNDGVFVNARFFNPQGIMLARGGLVVADYGNHTIRFIAISGSSNLTVTTLAGAPGVPGLVNATGTAARFRYPRGLAADSAGNIFVADTKNNAIRKIDTNNLVTTYATGFYEPDGVAVGDNGVLWVADTRNHLIKSVATNGTVTTMAGSGVAGDLDSLFATTAQFNNPRGVMWMGDSGLLISDSGSHTLRRFYTNSFISGYSVETATGSPGSAGLVDGAPAVAKFNSPVGLASDPLNGAFLIVDSQNNAIRRYQLSEPQPPVGAPRIGYVRPLFDGDGNFLGYHLVDVSPGQAVFNNDEILAVLPSETGVETYFTFGDFPTNVFNDTVPDPTPANGLAPAPFTDGQSSLPLNLLTSAQLLPDMRIKAFSTQSGRQPSAIVSGRIQFKTANPVIIGDNAANFTMTNFTIGAKLYYTTDGSDPTNGGANIFVSGNAPLSFNLGGSNMLFKVRAFKANYTSSAIVSNLFSPTNFLANKISLGFENGEASSDFVASPGQTFITPVTMALLDGQSVYSLQFNLTATNNGAAPAVRLGAVGFQSMLLRTFINGSLGIIPPAMFIGLRTNVVTNIFFALDTNNALVPFTNVFTDVTNVLTNLVFLDTNVAYNLLGVGWLERNVGTADLGFPGFFTSDDRIYNPIAQTLLSMSRAHDTTFPNGGNPGRVILGGYSVAIPSNATPGQTYTLRIGRPSATVDGISQDVFVDAPTSPAIANIGTLKAERTLTVGSKLYVAGDVSPFRWFNAGDFGDTNGNAILNNDVLQTFQVAVYRIHGPPSNSDFFDGFDSSDAVVNPAPLLDVSSGNDTVINGMTQGDGFLDVTDVFVTFRRSLDPSLAWVGRYWTNIGGVAFRTNVAVSNLFRGSANSVAKTLAAAPASTPNGEPATVTFTAGDIQGGAGQTVQIPITASISGGLPVRALMLNLTIEPLDGSPALTQPVQFTPATDLGTPWTSTSEGPGNFAAVWLDTTRAGISGTNLVGTLTVTIPANAAASAAYGVRFEHVSASPNGLGLFPQTIEHGLVTLANRQGSSLGDNIPDAWRLRHFGTVSNFLSAAQADADGDGVPNWAEYRAGTGPVDIKSALRVNAPQLVGGMNLSFPSVSGKTYVIESAAALFDAAWIPLATNVVGTGRDIQFQDAASPDGTPRFYRVRLQE